MGVPFGTLEHRDIHPMRIELHVRKYGDSGWLQAMAADCYRMRNAPWDPAKPDLRGFNIQRPSEEALLAALPPALKVFLERLGFTIDGEVKLARDHDADVANPWPGFYVAEVPASRPANDASRLSSRSPEHSA